jgi:hypothetical protein
MVTLENEEIQREVLKSGVYLGFTKHRCMEAYDGSQNKNGPNLYQCYKCQKWEPKHRSSECQDTQKCVWCGSNHPHKNCQHFQNKDRANAKFANCGGGHPGWSQECGKYRKAAQNTAKTTAAKIVSSSSVNEGTLVTIIDSIKACIAIMVANVVTRAILDLRDDEKRSHEGEVRAEPSDIALKIGKDTVEALNGQKILPSGKPIVVTEVHITVGKGVFPHDNFPLLSQATSAPQSELAANVRSASGT